MDKPISNCLQITFLIHSIISAILGAAMWLIPGRTLMLAGLGGRICPGSRLGAEHPGADLCGSIHYPLARRGAAGAGVIQLPGLESNALGAGCHCGAARDRLVRAGRRGVFLRAGEGPCVPCQLIGWAVMILLAAFAVAWGVAWRSEGEQPKRKRTTPPKSGTQQLESTAE